MTAGILSVIVIAMVIVMCAKVWPKVAQRQMKDGFLRGSFRIMSVCHLEAAIYFFFNKYDDLFSLFNNDIIKIMRNIHLSTRLKG